MRGYGLPVIRQIIYKLKRIYGLKLEIIHATSTSDLITGIKTVTRDYWIIKNAILLPEIIKQQSTFAHFLRQEFRFGSEVQIGDRTLLVDQRDMPGTIEVEGSSDWYAVIKHLRFQIIASKHYPEDSAYLLTVRELKGELPSQIIAIIVHDIATTNDILMTSRDLFFTINDNVATTEGVS